jgi:hypothetical protein
VPKNVAAAVAQSGAGFAATFSGVAAASVFIARPGIALKPSFIGNILDGRRHYVLPTGPLSQIDEPTALAAKRKIL